MRGVVPAAATVALQSHSRPKARRRAPTTKRSVRIGMSFSARPGAATMAAATIDAGADAEERRPPAAHAPTAARSSAPRPPRRRSAERRTRGAGCPISCFRPRSCHVHSDAAADRRTPSDQARTPRDHPSADVELLPAPRLGGIPRARKTSASTSSSEAAAHVTRTGSASRGRPFAALSAVRKPSRSAWQRGRGVSDALPRQPGSRRGRGRRSRGRPSSRSRHFCRSLRRGNGSSS